MYTSPVITRKRPVKRVEAFTLIEMLVVIAILAILATLIIPSINKSIARAQSIRCLSNLRNLGVGMMTYSVENRGRLPAMRAPVASGGGWSGPYWTNLLEPFVGEESSLAASRRKGIFYCPSEKNTHSISDYGANPLVIRHPNAEGIEQAMTLSRIENVTGTLLLADAQILRSDGPIGSWHIAPNWFTPDIPEQAPSSISGASPRHNGFVNLLFADGHVESLPYEEFRRRGRAVFTPEND